ncbi:peptidoglycan-binding protein [Thermocatellispora tengchongensis]
MVLAGAAVVAAAVGFGGGDPAGVPSGPAADAPAGPAGPATATVVRTTLTETTTVEGSLGFGDAVTYTAPPGGGTVTWLPEPGVTIRRGEAVYSVDARRVTLFYGTSPLYRTLGPGMSGKDVELLERNLRRLGYRGFTADRRYDWRTAEAVRRWQRDVHLPQTGTVEPHRVLVRPGPIRIALVHVPFGVPAQGALFTYTGAEHEITAYLEPAERHLVHEGQKAEITVPEGGTAEGTVTEVGSVATEKEGESMIEVTVSASDPALRTFDVAPVDVTIVTGRRENVLAVPVNALVALPGGGYAVQVVRGSATTYAEVETGMFGDGQVEVSGPGIAEGTTVVVPG